MMDQKWRRSYDKALLQMLGGGKYKVVGYVSWIVVRSITVESMEISWYPNIFDRFHELKILLPKKEFVTCVECYKYDEKPRLFVKSKWLENIHLKDYSIFCMVDAIGVKAQIRAGKLTRNKLVRIREYIDAIANKYPKIAFISFADSLLLKGQWSIGTYKSSINYVYEPEEFFKAILDIKKAYKKILGLEAYAVLTQGNNEYYNDKLLHVSKNNNHISLNSLGLPFSQLLAIDDAVRSALRRNAHSPFSLYMDSMFFYSLNFDFGFNRDALLKYFYQSPMSSVLGEYICGDLESVARNVSPIQKTK